MTWRENIQENGGFLDIPETCPLVLMSFNRKRKHQFADAIDNRMDGDEREMAARVS